MLVDSGADFSLIPKDLGLILGYELAVAETLSQAEGIGGCISYALRIYRNTIGFAYLYSSGSMDAN